MTASGYDRAVQAYNDLARKFPDQLDREFTKFHSQPPKLSAALARLCGAHQISFTQDHCGRTKQQRWGWPTRQGGPGCYPPGSGAPPGQPRPRPLVRARDRRPSQDGRRQLFPEQHLTPLP